MAGCLDAWLVGGLLGSLVGCLVAWLLDCLVAWLLGCLVAWLLGCLVAWLLGCLVAWLLGCLVAWLLGCLVAWLLGCLVAWLLGCLVAWLLGLVGEVIGATIRSLGKLVSLRAWHGEPYSARRWRASEAQKATPLARGSQKRMSIDGPVGYPRNKRVPSKKHPLHGCVCMCFLRVSLW